MRLIKILSLNFSIEATLRERKNKSGIYWRIRIQAASVPRLREIVLPYFVTSMLYKLGLGTKG
jgi:hypothetical protein